MHYSNYRLMNTSLVAVLLGLAISCPAVPPNDGYFPERVVLNITADPAHAIAITWRTALPLTEPTVQFTLASAEPRLESKAQSLQAEVYRLELKKDSSVYQYSAQLTGLQPQSLYAFRVGSSRGWSEWSHFQTAAERETPFRFLYLGDPQSNIISYVSRALRAAYQTAPDAAFLLCCGDIVNDGYKDELWGEIFYAAGWIPRQLPWVLTVGNHEYGSTPRRLTPLYRPQFTLPLNGPQGVAESAYFFDYQGVRIVMLNSNELIAEQARWLDSVLTVKPQRWTILAMHHPIYPIASNRDYTELRQAFLPVIERHSVDLVLAGHDHAYARSFKLHNGQKVATDQKGTVYYVSVCGPKQYQLESKYLDLYARTATNQQLFQVVNVSHEKLHIQTFDVTGKLVDELTLRK